MFLKKKSFILKGALLYFAAVVLAACNSETPKEDTINTLLEDTTAVQSDTIGQESYSLPSPLQIASIFKKSGLKYKEGVTSPMKDPSKYITNLDKALNLGVYSADMSYTVLNKQNQESITYMNLSRQLADKLGMSKIFEEKDLAKRFNKNIGRKDSLTALISELQMVTDIYLDQNNQQQITSIVFAGAWIESLYIASKVFEQDNEQAFVDKFSKQMSILGSIINSLKAVEKKDPAIKRLIEDMQSVKDIYDGFPEVKQQEENADNTVKDLILTNQEVASLTKKIEELRTKFING